MNFHIIYTPQSIKYLSYFTYSLCSYLSANFIQVSNNCTLKERASLKYSAITEDKLRYHCYPTNQMNLHGKVIDYLQAINQDEYFCFMDSDIFALSELPDLKNIMEEEDLSGLFSAMPLWVKKSEYIFRRNFRIMLGTYNQLGDGQCIGSTYFAIYKSKDLKEIIEYYGASFEEASSKHLSVEIQNLLKRIGFNQTFFDTGKVINLLLQHHGYKLRNITLPQLCHIGGTSYETTYQSGPIPRRKQLSEWIESNSLKSIFSKLSAYRRDKYFKKRFAHVAELEYDFNYNQRIVHRNATRKHFLSLFLSLSENRAIPEPPDFHDKEISDNVRIAHLSYIDMFKKYYK